LPAVLRGEFGLAADFEEFGLRMADLDRADLDGADLEREFILFKTCIQSGRNDHDGRGRLKSALIRIGDSAPIRDR
jgi:uncharacterized protein YjbI with pentapeptide repeats